MNFMLSTYMLILKGIELQERIAQKLGMDLAVPSHQERKHLEKALKDYSESATKPEMSGVLARIRRIETLLKNDPPWSAIGNQLKILHEAFEDDTNDSFIYVYPRSKVELLERFPEDWKSALNAFPSIGTEAKRGIDCFALDHNTACVFHMCRVAEIGLRTLARERGVVTGKRGVPIEWATWGQVFEKIDPYVEDLRKKGERTEER